jgi:radical SAM protein (TIGR01212 family)
VDFSIHWPIQNDKLMDLGKLYTSFNSYLRQRFGQKVWKVVIDAGFTCPNRDGSKSASGCIYCNANGSGSGKKDPIRTQVLRQMERLSQQGINLFFAYFQAFSNTYAPVEILKQRYDEALMDERIVGLSVGTRPDCVSEEIAALLATYGGKREVWVELGLQSIHPASLEFIGRCHGLFDFENAVVLLRRAGIKVCVHLIFGLPGETQEMMLETVRYLVPLGVEGVKFHPLYIEHGTRLADLHVRNPIRLMTREDYCRTVVEALKILPADVVIQRLTGEGDPSKIVAPKWILEKGKTLAMIQSMMKEDSITQGCGVEN